MRINNVNSKTIEIFIIIVSFNQINYYHFFPGSVRVIYVDLK
jgi:hypothetical protein